VNVTSEDVALASLVVAAIGIIVPWRTRVGDRAHAGEEGMIARTHERELAADERTYADRRDLYLELSEVLLRILIACDDSYPVPRMLPAPEPPVFPPKEDTIRMDARVAVLGSAGVVASYEAWAAAYGQVEACLHVMRGTEQRGLPITGQQRDALNNARAALRERAGEVDMVIRTDVNRRKA
jgi:hypothetical protein